MAEQNTGTVTSSRKRRAVLASALLAAVFVAGLITPSILESRGLGGATALRTIYSPLCHQIPQRSLVAWNSPVAVCARCAGLYVGGAIGLLLSAGLFVGRRDGFPRILFFVALAPTAIDALLPWVGLPALSNVPRFWLALPAGFVAALFLAVGIADLFSREPRGNSSGRVSAQDTLEVVDG